MLFLLCVCTAFCGKARADDDPPGDAGYYRTPSDFETKDAYRAYCYEMVQAGLMDAHYEWTPEAIMYARNPSESNYEKLKKSEARHKAEIGAAGDSDPRGNENESEKTGESAGNETAPDIREPEENVVMTEEGEMIIGDSTVKKKAGTLTIVLRILICAAIAFIAALAYGKWRKKR